mgnify:FL=1
MVTKSNAQRYAYVLWDEVLDLFCISGAPDEIGAGLASRWGDLADQTSLGVDFWNSHRDNSLWSDAAAKLQQLA